MRVAIVVGEASGDILGAGLIEHLKSLYPNASFEGIGGPLMIEQGFKSHYAMERLAVMGLIEPLKRLPELLKIRKNLRKRYSKNLPDVFIGIDAPDFNLALEAKLRKKGVKTVHYVSPSVWAWRQGRIKKVAKAVDLMLTLFPFEADFYRKHNVHVEFVGHPLADDIPLDVDKKAARSKLGLAQDIRFLALLPGSRKSEVKHMAQVFIDAAKRLQQKYPDIEVIIPAASAARLQELKVIIGEQPDFSVHLFEGRSHDVMAASDAVLMASGTTTLEALLLKRPMVIAYIASKLTYKLLAPLIKSEFVGLPNLLAKRLLVPELIQNNATVEKLTQALDVYFSSKESVNELQDSYLEIHQSLRKNASEKAAHAIAELIGKRN